jgi:hypothetical protein
MASKLVPAAPGQIRTNRLLDTEATYRVIGVQDAMVEVEVIEAPGLNPGQRFSFAADAVAAMVLVSEAAMPAEAAAPVQQKPRLA